MQILLIIMVCQPKVPYLYQDHIWLVWLFCFFLSIVLSFPSFLKLSISEEIMIFLHSKSYWFVPILFDRAKCFIIPYSSFQSLTFECIHLFIKVNFWLPACQSLNPIQIYIFKILIDSFFHRLRSYLQFISKAIYFQLN